MQCRKLCRAVQWLTLKGEGGVYYLNQSDCILTYKTDLNKSTSRFGFWVKCFWKLVICYLSSVKRNDKCAQSVWIAIEVMAKFYIEVGRTHFSLTLPLPCHSTIQPSSSNGTKEKKGGKKIPTFPSLYPQYGARIVQQEVKSNHQGLSTWLLPVLGKNKQ